VTVPLPPFTVGAANYIEALADRKRKQTLEVIQAVRSDGWVRVVNTWVPVTGKVQLRARQTVAVMWRDGIPQVAMMNQGRRGGGDIPPTEVGAPLVEELIRAPESKGATTHDLWFRNGTILSRLRVAAALAASPSDVRNAWGLDRTHFLVRHFVPILQPRYSVFRLNDGGTARNPTKVITTAPTASLVQTYNPRTSTIVLGTFTTIYAGGGSIFAPSVVLGPLLTTGYSSGDGGVRFTGIMDDQVVDDRGHLLLSVRVGIIYFYDSVLPNWTTSRPYIVDLTDNTILYNGASLIAGQFGVTVHNPVSINLDTLPKTPQNQVIDPFGDYRLLFVTARNGTVTLMAGALFRWAVAPPGGPGAPPLHNVATQFLIFGPAGIFPVRAFAFGTDTLNGTEGIYFIGGPSDDYVLWVVYQGPQPGLQTFLPFGAVASAVSMANFTAPSDTKNVGTPVAWFPAQLRLLRPDGLYDALDSNQTGHFFVAFQGEGGAITLDAATPGFPPRGTQGDPAAGVLLDYNSETAFIRKFLEDQVAGLDAIDAYTTLVDFTAFQVILDTTGGPLPVRETG
jgi:hypothetical protein